MKHDLLKNGEPHENEGVLVIEKKKGSEINKGTILI